MQVIRNKPSTVLDLAQLGGKGAEEVDSDDIRPLRCVHRWALVSRTALREKKVSMGTLLIQTCRRCGTFRVSAFWPRTTPRGIATVGYRVKYLKAEEGLRKATFEPFDVDTI